MIAELIEFGKWLDSNGFDDFGRLIKDTDRIINIKIIENDEGLTFENIHDEFDNFINNPDLQLTYSDFKKGRMKGFSLFSNNLFFETNQNIMIPSNSALACLTPFIISLKRITETKIKNSKKQNSEKDGEFVKLLNDLDTEDNNLKDYYSIYSKDNIINGDIDLFNKTLDNIEELKNVLKEYYSLLYNNWDLIENVKNTLKNKDPDIFVYFELPKKYILINDIIYFYCKYLKLREESTKSLKSQKCQFCGENEVTYVKFSTINLDKSYNWNYMGDLENSKLKLCRNCSALLYLGIQKLIHIFENNFILIPKLKGNDCSKFKLIGTEINTYYNNIEDYKSKFYLLNKFLSGKENDENYHAYFSFDFLIFDKIRMGEDIKTINKYVENYKAFLTNFEDINLYNDNSLKYIFNEKKIFKDKKNKIENIFDVEKLIKSFFSQTKNGKVTFPNFFYFYEIYIKKLNDIFGNWNSKTRAIFTKNMHNIFSYIYELQEESFTVDMLNEIALDYFIRVQNNVENPIFEILKSLNYYFLIRNEFVGVNMEMLKEDNMYNLKMYFKDYTKENNEKILKLIKDDPAIKYYLLGQFIRKIDNSKGGQNKKGGVFSNFVKNANRNNIKNLFITEVLQKNIYYIEGANQKRKFIFKMFENSMSDLFNFDKENLTFEDCLILIFTGNYTENVLSSDEKNNEKKSD
jgi:CRISPR-associated protein Csh1